MSVTWVANGNDQPTVHRVTCRYFKQAKPENIRRACCATAKTLMCRTCKPTELPDIARRPAGAPRPDYVAPAGTRWVRGALLPPEGAAMDSRRREARRLARMWHPSPTWACQADLPFDPDWVAQLVTGQRFQSGYLAGRTATECPVSPSAEDEALANLGWA